MKWGAVYIAPSSCSPLELLTEEGASLTVEIPENAIDQNTEMIAADTFLHRFMSKYSKIFFGQKKYHDIQPFRFPIYNDLVAGEIEGIEALARKQASNTYALLKIAKDVSQKQDIPVQEALDALSDVDGNQDLLFDYVDELAQIQTQGQSVSEMKIETVTLFMRYRAELKERNKWVQVPDWEMDDTREMPRRLLDDIYDFVDWERNGWPEDDDSEEVEGN